MGVSLATDFTSRVSRRPEHVSRHLERVSHRVSHRLERVSRRVCHVVEDFTLSRTSCHRVNVFHVITSVFHVVACARLSLVHLCLKLRCVLLHPWVSLDTASAFCQRCPTAGLVPHPQACGHFQPGFSRLLLGLPGEIQLRHARVLKENRIRSHSVAEREAGRLRWQRCPGGLTANQGPSP